MNKLDTIFPFGRDVDTLVVCINDEHRRHVIEAFQLKAQYCLYGNSITGRSYQKVIIFRPSPLMGVDAERKFMQYIDYNVRTCLRPGGVEVWV